MASIIRRGGSVVLGCWWDCGSGCVLQCIFTVQCIFKLEPNWESNQRNRVDTLLSTDFATQPKIGGGLEKGVCLSFSLQNFPKQIAKLLKCLASKDQPLTAKESLRNLTQQGGIVRVLLYKLHEIPSKQR